jgi:hypothetical protein
MSGTPSPRHQPEDLDAVVRFCDDDGFARTGTVVGWGSARSVDGVFVTGRRAREVAGDDGNTYILFPSEYEEVSR